MQIANQRQQQHAQECALGHVHDVHACARRVRVAELETTSWLGLQKQRSLQAGGQRAAQRRQQAAADEVLRGREGEK